MTAPVKRKFVYQPHDEALIKRAKEAEHLNAWRVEKGLDDPKLDDPRATSAGVRLAKQKRVHAQQQRPQKLARQKAARQKLKAQAKDNLGRDQKRYEERLASDWPIVRRKNG